MKERHPIDDLFREGLYNSEAVPPAEVWERVVAQRSWGHRLLAGLQRRWAVSLLALLLVGTPLAWYGMVSDAGPLTAPMANTSTVVTEGVTDVLPQEGKPTALANTDAERSYDAEQKNSIGLGADRVTETGGVAPTNSTSAVLQHSDMGPQSSRSGQDNGVIKGNAFASPNAQQLSIVNDGQNAATEPLGGSEDGLDAAGVGSKTSRDRMVEVGVFTTPLGDAAPIGSATEDYVDMDFLLARSRSITYPRLLDSMLVSDRAVEPPYVLPNGAWWLGVQFGWNEWNGSWSGTSPLAEEMDKAEEWQNGWQAGIVGGRTWKSGLSVSLGLDVANMKSRFLFTDASANASDTGALAFVLDTTWQVNAIAPDSSYVVYTYSFDLVAVPIGERGVQYSASNRYTLLNVPVELAWQKNVKRFTFAPRIGLNAGFFIGRNGKTLLTANNTEAGATAVPTDDRRADDRFSLLLSGTAGLDVGYALTERIQLFIGPGYSTVLTSFGDNTLRPTINGFTARGRLVYEFGMKQRKSRK